MARRTVILRIALAALLAFWLFPVYWMLLTSLKPAPIINRPVPAFVFTPTLENYRGLFVDFDFLPSLLNSLTIASLTTLIVAILAFLAGYALARLELPGEKHIAIFILSLRFLPPIAIGIPFFLIWQGLGLLDTRGGLVLVYVAFNLPFAVWILRGFLVDMPRELEEAAALDGLGILQTMWRIILPLSGPAIAVTSMFTFIFTWNEYFFALLLTSIHAVTVPVTIAKLIMPYTILWGHIGAAVVVQLVPMLLVVALLQRHLVRGLTLGAVK